MYEKHHLLGSEFFQPGEISIKILHRDPQPEYPIHTHDFSELVLILDGKGTHFTRKNTFEVERGDLFVINGDRAHGYKDLKSLKLINILFDLKKLHLPDHDIHKSAGFHTLFTIEPLLRGDGRFTSRLKLDEKQIEEVKQIILKIEKEQTLQREGYSYLTAALFMQLIIYISRIYSRNSESGKSNLYNLGETISFMENNMDRSISIKELLDISHMSESSLLRTFRKITGTSPLDYHLRKRIDRACSLLENTELPVTMIAYDLGFTDSNYFARQFRRIKGESAREYRKKYSARNI
ncbi:MAG: helix-turn-helix domain-containing protein [Spirochaetales bacterium]|nr:helix-turn-helix domain-containing protein [Spirochaetales bacterium]